MEHLLELPSYPACKHFQEKERQRKSRTQGQSEKNDINAPGLMGDQETGVSGEQIEQGLSDCKRCKHQQVASTGGKAAARLRTHATRKRIFPVFVNSDFGFREVRTADLSGATTMIL
jgi:hypothetical protein